jgi:hypothetical protein
MGRREALRERGRLLARRGARRKANAGTSLTVRITVRTTASPASWCNSDFGLNMEGVLRSVGRRTTIGFHRRQPPWVPGAQVLLGGYLSWQDRESNSWWQETWFDGGAPKIVRLGPIDQRTGISQPRIQFLALMEDWFPRYSPNTNTVGEPFNGIEPPLLPEVTATNCLPP